MLNDRVQVPVAPCADWHEHTFHRASLPPGQEVAKSILVRISTRDRLGLLLLPLDR